MQSRADSVDKYLEDLPEDRKEVLGKLRTLCRKSLKGYDETMRFGMPTYGKPGLEPEVAFASQKNYISLYIMKQDVVQEHKPVLKGINVGKSCIKYSTPEKMNFAVIQKLLTATTKSKFKICG